MPQIIDNLGAPLVATNDPNIWVGNLGTLIDIRTKIGSLGAPLIEMPNIVEIKMNKRNIQLNKIFN